MSKIFTFLIFMIVVFCAKAQPNNYAPKDPNFFPIAVWLQSTWNAESYRNAGINLYIGLWNPLDSAQLSDLRKANMNLICEQNSFGLKHLQDTIIYGWNQMDEPDNAQWNDSTKNYDPCLDPAIIIDRYNKFRANDSTRPVYLNLGQGVAWLEWYGRGSKCYRDIDSYKISKNGYIKGCDVISFDIYPVNSSDTATKDKLWLVPKGIDSLYSWGNNSKPAMCWIETTQINESGKRKPTPHEVKAEVWMALIHGAKGIGYFCHSWYPSFVEYALLLDSNMLKAVKEINSEITALAPVLNKSNSKDYASVLSSNPNVPIDIMTKSAESDYIFAAAMRNDTTTAIFSVKSGSKVNVIGENRTIDIVNGKFWDSFIGYGVHLYKIDNSSIIENEDIDKIRMYLSPNPAKDILQMQFNKIDLPVKTEFYDILGNCVLKQELNSLSNNIDISSLSYGIYYVRNKYSNKFFIKY